MCDEGGGGEEDDEEQKVVSRRARWSLEEDTYTLELQDTAGMANKDDSLNRSRGTLIPSRISLQRRGPTRGTRNRTSGDVIWCHGEWETRFMQCGCSPERTTYHANGE